MFKYIFSLGHQPALSLLEIKKVLPQLTANFSFELIGKDFVLLDSQQEIQTDNLMKVLGGTKKIGLIIGELPLNREADLFNNFKKLIFKKSFLERIQYGFSLYFHQLSKPSQAVWRKKANQLGLDLKREVKKYFKHCRFLVSQEAELTSVIIQKEKLITQGFDFLLIITPAKIYYGQTSACQDYQEFSQRDYGRPSRDAHRGMLPVKLAKMLINLAGLSKEKIILDPFCGSGTILQEALLLGYQNLLGSDLDKQAVINSANNLKWLIEKYHLNTGNLSIKTWQSDIRNLSEKIPPTSVGAIITEPYLGSPLRSQADYSKRDREKKQLAELYYQAFINFYKLLSAGGRVIMIWPVFYLADKQFIFLPQQLLAMIISLGFKQENLSAALAEYPDPKSYLTDRKTLIYWRPGQRVAREILIFIK